MSKKLYIINGPNLNLLGIREPEKYGNISLDKIKKLCLEKCNNYNLDLSFFQSNIEGKLIDEIHNAINDGQGIIINAGALTHTSIGLLDALNMFKGPKIELHITYISPVVNGIIAGFGFNSYLHAVDAIKDLIKD